MDVRETGTAQPDEAGLNREILDTCSALVKRLAATGQSIAASFGMAPSDLLALVKPDGVLTMSELAQRMGCDASFVTAVADALERHGFARREWECLLGLLKKMLSSPGPGADSAAETASDERDATVRSG